jgi:hypothetical protein
VNDLEARGHRLNTGAIGTKLRLPVLTKYGRGDLAYEVATQTEYPSWGYWVTQGATSSWETWRNEGPDQSLDHPFLGTVDDWLYQHLAGIQAAEPGYATVRIAPVFPAQLQQVSATVTIPRGEVMSSWQRGEVGLALSVTVPPGVTTELVLRFAQDRVEVMTGHLTLLDATASRTVYVVSSTEWGGPGPIATRRVRGHTDQIGHVDRARGGSLVVLRRGRVQHCVGDRVTIDLSRVVARHLSSCRHIIVRRGRPGAIAPPCARCAPR